MQRCHVGISFGNFTCEQLASPDAHFFCKIFHIIIISVVSDLHHLSGGLSSRNIVEDSKIMFTA